MSLRKVAAHFFQSLRPRSFLEVYLDKLGASRGVRLELLPAAADGARVIEVHTSGEPERVEVPGKTFELEPEALLTGVRDAVFGVLNRQGSQTSHKDE